MHRTPDQWSLTKPAAVLAGSAAQGRNVLSMAIDDLEEMGRVLRSIMAAAELGDVDACREIARQSLTRHDLSQPIFKRD